MRPPYLLLLAVMAALAGLVFCLHLETETPEQRRSVNGVDFYADDLSPLNPANLQEGLELGISSAEPLTIDAPSIPESWVGIIPTNEELDSTKDFVSDQDVTLAWIAAQQNTDGSWEASLTPGQKNIQSRLGRNGATALALLCLLEAGHTHQGKSKYKQQVYRGLDYLIYHDDIEQRALDMIRYSYEESDGQMISHALAALALCEAYSRTRDKALVPFAQGALNYIAQRQDSKTGGWGVNRNSVPDLVTTGWVVMALQRGTLSYLKVEPSVINAAKEYIERAQPTPEHQLQPLELALWGQSTIILGATRKTPGLAECVRELNAIGFSRTDCAYNFLAYSVMRRWDGDTQRQWFKARQKLTNDLQESHGTNKGTWPPYDPAGQRDFWNSRLERTCFMFLARNLENGSDWRHWTLKDRPDPPRDESFPL